jgi:hypothetical protein
MEAKDTNPMCALESNIKNKGENSYYYAHKYKFEDSKKDPNAQTITGPGIITGGDAILIQTEKRAVEIIKEPKQITKYIFYDDDKVAIVKMDLPKDAEDISDDCLQADFQKRSFHLKINVPNGEAYYFAVSKLYLKIVPENSTCKIVKTKNGKVIKITFAKEDIDEEWSKVSA